MNEERAELEALGFEVPDSVTPIVACRSWAFTPISLKSHSGTPWTPGKALKAGCMHPFEKEHFAPAEKCSCGIYAAKPEQANVLVPRRPHYVFGEIYLWGKILEGRRGYRAEYAYPKQFFVVDQHLKDRLESLGFGVPVTLVEGMMPYMFPFPQGTNEAPSRRASRIYFTYLAGLPSLVVGLVEALSLDMSRAINQVLVGLMFALGTLVGSVSYLLQRRIRRMHENLYSNRPKHLG